METFAVLLSFFMVIMPSSSLSNETCDSPQYLEVGKSGIIRCSFEDDLYAVAWYTSESLAEQTSLVRLVDGVKIGERFSSGEFNIRADGSLVINNVTLLHDTNFTVFVFPSKGDNPSSITIESLVVVKPSVTFPVIEVCRGENLCYTQVGHDFEVSCHIANSRPAINLKWVARTSREDLHLLSKSSVFSTDGTVFTSQAVTKDIFIHSTYLSLLVCCMVDDIPGMMLEDESVIFIENSENSLLAIESIVKYVEKHSLMKLTCSNENISLVVWKKAGMPGDEFQVVSYAAYFENGFSKTISNNVMLQDDGSLFVHEIESHQEGLYGCIYENDYTGGIALFDVIVYVHVQPVVQGCTHHTFCVLDGQRVGNLSCSVKGIRPKVQLEWKTFSEQDSSLITFTDHQLKTSSDGDVFDVTLNSYYQLKDPSTTRITILCTTTKSNNEILESSAKFDLLFYSVQPGDETNSHLLWMLMVFIPLCLLVIVLWRLHVRGRQRKQRMRIKFPQEEGAPMIHPVTTQVESQSDLKSVFARELKTKYKYQYDAVQPIPYIRDRLYCVDRVFVEGGFEKLISKDRIEGLGNWQKLSSYHKVTNISSSSTRTIIEGDPGYGKSTLTLQLAYDWCNCNVTSPLADVDILILLRLRQLGGVHSMFRAIKQFLLPRDTRLNEEDIQNILQQSKLTVFILDGFDEYPEQETEYLNDIISTIKGEMFQENFVILTSRSFLLPKSYPPQTHRIRLTGFDSNARDAYIRKAVVGDNSKAAEKIKRSLQKNSVLQGLCQVPLFFVMFAHMTHESDKFLKFKSVTSFFQYMLACFHSHMKNKMEDMNVKKIDLHENEHERLDEVAFEALSGKNQQIVWNKRHLIQRLGKEFYNQYRAIGILVEEEVLDISDKPRDSYYETEVRFYHKLFCEWYAAHHLCRKVVELEADLSKILEHMNPFDLQYTYRFACGLNSDAGDKIIEYLRGIKDGDKFAVLCILEQSGKFNKIKDTVVDLCSNYITIDNTDNMLLQGSIVQLLEIGSNNQIPVSFLWLKDCFSSVDLSTGQILLKSEISIPVLPTLKELAIGARGREFTNEEFASLIQYSSTCPSLKSLRFCHLLMPQVLDGRSETLSVLKTCKFQVLWCTNDDDYFLDVNSGKWEKCDQTSSKNFFEGNIPAKKNLLVSLMKLKYDEMTRAVQVIPSDYNKQLDISQFYTENMLECLVSKENDTETWVPLQSYKSIFTDSRVRSKRRIIKGEQGIGKSTLALQMAHDWCHGNSKSPLSNFDLFLLVSFHPTKQMFKSIFKMLKHRVIGKDSPLSYNDIKSVLHQASSVLVVFDGFNFHFDDTKDFEFDVTGIIQGKMLKNIDVITTCTHVPSKCAPGTKFLRLTGFDIKAQDEYIRKNIAGDNIASSDKIRHELQNNPIIGVLCQIPFFFVLFAHLIHENKELQTIKTVTSYFRYLIKSFHSPKRKMKDSVDVQKCQFFDDNHNKLDKIAFEGLCKKDPQIVWGKEELRKRLGDDYYNRYVETGILVEEISNHEIFSGNSSADKHDLQVRFYHILFMEWYAAHHLARCAEEFSLEKLTKYLQTISPLDLQYFYLFACGLSQAAAADNIISCVRKNRGDTKFELLCVIEQGVSVEDIFQDLRNLCSEVIGCKQSDNKQLVLYTIQLLRIASNYKISISWVHLSNCYSTVDLRGGNHLQLKSNLSIPVLTTLNKLTINTYGESKNIASEEFTGILQYSSKCLALKELELSGCLLPPSVQAESISILRSRNVKVRWYSPVSDWYLLNLKSGRWERGIDGGRGEMTDRDYQNEVEEFRRYNRRRLIDELFPQLDHNG